MHIRNDGCNYCTWFRLWIGHSWKNARTTSTPFTSQFVHVCPRMLLLSLSSMSSSSTGMFAYDLVLLAFPLMWLTVMMNPPTSTPTSWLWKQNPATMGMMVRVVKLQKSSRYPSWIPKSLRYLMMMIVVSRPNLGVWHSQWKVCRLLHPTLNWRRRSWPRLSLEQVWLKGSSLSSCLVLDYIFFSSPISYADLLALWLFFSVFVGRAVLLCLHVCCSKYNYYFRTSHSAANLGWSLRNGLLWSLVLLRITMTRRPWIWT